MDDEKPGCSNKISYTLTLGKMRRNSSYDENSISPATVLIKLQNLLCTALQEPDTINLQLIKDVLETAWATFERRCDLTAVAHRLINKLFWDIELLLIANRPELACHPQFLPRMLTFWKKHLPPIVNNSRQHEIFDRILCPRNFAIFEQSKDPKSAWKACAEVVSGLFAHELLDDEQFERQTIRMFKHNWGPETVEFLSDCLETIVENYVKETGIQKKLSLIASWVAGFRGKKD